MIFYFSSTGNCRYAAKIFAEALGDIAMSIGALGKLRLAKGEKLGFVFPTYFWRLPSIVDDFMSRLEFEWEEGEPFIFFVSSYGTTTGGTEHYMRRHLRQKGYKLTASYGIKTVDDYTVLFDVTDKERIASILEEERVQIEKIRDSLLRGERGLKMKAKLPMIAVACAAPFYKKARKTDKFSVDTRLCVGCRICERECPAKAIRVSDGTPRWVKDECVGCLHCVHACPRYAISRGEETKKNGQYKHPRR